MTTDPNSRPAVAVVGAGIWGRNHVRAWSSLGCLRWVCDPDPRQRQQAAAMAPGAAVSGSYDEVLADAAVAAVVIAAPASRHEELALRALDAGKDVLVEKPLALTLAGGRRVVEAADRAGRVLAVGHLLEYHPAFLAIRRLLAEGALGELRYLYSHRLNLGRFRTEENALWSFAPHDVALMLRLTGSLPVDVDCHGGSYVTGGVEDVTTTHLGFEGGVRGHIFVSWLHPFKEHRFVVVGSEQMAVFDDSLDWDAKLLLYPHQVDLVEGELPVARRADGVAVPLVAAEPLRAECEDFLRAVETRTSPLVDGASGVAVLSVLERAQAALSRPRPRVAPPDVYVHPTATVDDGASLGEGTRVWHYCHVSSGAVVGARCTLGQNVFVADGAVIGDDVRLQNNVSVYDGVELADGVFCGPSAVFTNVRNPRSQVSRRDEFGTTRVGRGATLGANCTIVCGNQVGAYAFVAAGAVVTTDVRPHALVAGVPARQIGWACTCGERLELEDDRARCGRCGSGYELADGDLRATAHEGAS